MKEAFVPCKKFSDKSIAVLHHANEIVQEYMAQGYQLTLRQLYYQFVARGLFENDGRNYGMLGRLLNDGRMMGLIDWKAIVDRTRFARMNAHWPDAASIVRDAARQFKLDRWENQDHYVEVWVEKDALIDVVKTACTPLDVTCLSCRGYMSVSSVYEASKRYLFAGDEGKCLWLFHLGDHDPSGIDMTRDIRDRLEQFIGSSVYVKRLGLNMDQVEKYSPPPNPTKLKDTRAENYVSRFGKTSWELDALEPKVLVKLIKDAVEKLIDWNEWEEREKEEELSKQKLLDFSESL